MMNANWSFYAPFILKKTIDFWLRLNIFIFDNHSLLRAEIVLNPIMDQTYIFLCFGHFWLHSPILTYFINKTLP